jgi:hypothetical protein
MCAVCFDMQNERRRVYGLEQSVERRDIETCGAHNWALIQARPALPTVIAAPPNYAAPLKMTNLFPPAPALCPIAITLPATMFPIQLWAVAAADPVSQKQMVIQAS